jgi:hypothetical protein
MKGRWLGSSGAGLAICLAVSCGGVLGTNSNTGGAAGDTAGASGSAGAKGGVGGSATGSGGAAGGGGAAGNAGGAGGGSPAIATTPLAGKIGGQAWSLMTGETDSFLSFGSNLFAELYSDSFTACTGQTANPNGNYFIANIPMAVGDYSLGLDLTVTFVVGGSQNLVATSGHLVVSSVSSSTVTGGINVTYNSDNTLDGQFTITVCP